MINEDPNFPAVRHFPHAFVKYDEIYQAKDWSRDNRILLVPGIEYEDPDNVVHIPVWGDRLPFLGAAQPTNDLTQTIPVSVTAIRDLVDADLTAAGINDCGLGPITILPSGSTSKLFLSAKSWVINLVWRGL